MADPKTRNPDVVDRYAQAVLTVAGADGAGQQVESELARFAEALRHNEELRSTLADADIDVERRIGIVEDLLGQRARAETSALVLMVVAAGRGADLIDIIEAAMDKAAAGRNRRVARVRSAVELTPSEQARLAAAIKESSGLEVEIRATVDPGIIGGVITEIGDDVIDGSVRRRLQQMRSGIR